MPLKQRASGKAISTPAGIGLGLLLSMMVTVGGAAILAWLVSGERIGEGVIGYGAMAILLLSSLLGALLAANRIKHLRVQMCLISGAAYYLTLLAITALFFGGQYQGMGVAAILVLVGSGAAALAGLRGSKGKQIKFKKKAYR